MFAKKLNQFRDLLSFEERETISSEDQDQEARVP